MGEWENGGMGEWENENRKVFIVYCLLFVVYCSLFIVNRFIITLDIRTNEEQRTENDEH